MRHHGLVPERRTDRRGVTTTRWVKPPTAPAPGARDLPPAPVGPREYTEADDSPRMEALFAALLPERQTAAQRDRALSNIHFLDHEVPDLLDQIAAACSRGEERRLWRYLLGNVDYRLAEHRLPGETRIGVERALAAYPLAARLSSSDGEPDSADIDDMEHSFDVATALTAASGRREVPAAMTRAMVLVAHLHGVHPFMSDAQADLQGLWASSHEDIDYIASRWGEVEPLIPLLVEHRSHDRVLVAALLDTGSRALASGSL